MEKLCLLSTSILGYDKDQTESALEGARSLSLPLHAQEKEQKQRGNTRLLHDKRKGGVRAGCPHSQCACTHILLHAAFLVQSSPQTHAALARLGLEVGRNQAAELLAQQTQRLQDIIHL